MALQPTPNRRDGKQRSGKLTTVQIIVATLISIAIALLLTAFHLTQQLAHRQAHRPLQSPALLNKDVTIVEKTSSKTKSASLSVSSEPYAPWPKMSYDPNTTPGVLRSNGAYAQNRIYCMVPFVWRKDFYDVIMSTWGKRCDQIFFFADSVVNLDGGIIRDFITGDLQAFKPYWEYPEGTFPDNIVFVNMSRSWDGCTDGKTGKPKICRHIWEKMWRSWVYVADNHIDRAEWFCKVDYDTFFFPENLQYYVQDYRKWDSKSEHHYFGHHLFHRQIIAGPCACWSHKTMTEIAEVYRKMPKGHLGPERGKCEDRDGATEEVSTAKCLNTQLGITPEEAVDDHHRDFIMLDPYENHLVWNRTQQGEWWFWKGKEKERGQMEECCAHRPIAIHKYKFPAQHEVLEKQFYGPERNLAISPIGKKMKPSWQGYVDKVRKAMGVDK